MSQNQKTILTAEDLHRISLPLSEEDYQMLDNADYKTWKTLAPKNLIDAYLDMGMDKAIHKNV